MEVKRTMAVVDDQVWLFHQVLTDPESSDAILVNFLDVDGGGQISVAEHAKPKERISHVFGKEDASDLSRYTGKGISDATNDHVLEDGSTLYEWGLLLFRGEISLLDELTGQLKD